MARFPHSAKWVTVTLEVPSLPVLPPGCNKTTEKFLYSESEIVTALLFVRWTEMPLSAWLSVCSAVGCSVSGCSCVALVSNRPMGWSVSVAASLWSKHSEIGRAKSPLWGSLREENAWGTMAWCVGNGHREDISHNAPIPLDPGVDPSFVSQSVGDTLRSWWAAGDMTNTKKNPFLLLSVERTPPKAPWNRAPGFLVLVIYS